MTDDSVQKIKDWFDTAMSLPAVDRDAFIAKQTQDDPQLGRKLADLVKHASSETSYSEALGSIAASALQDAPNGEMRPGSRVGNIEILRRIGEGGMGDVYLGNQTEPLKRQVAVKLIRFGMKVDQVLVRFEAERQVLARMNHPNIAQVFDAGSLDNGQPYFVMEYIDGQPVDEYCASKQLGLADRLALFTSICDGVQHAHQRGVIHRDLKPANVLVDTEGRPKIIDFGIAKLVAETDQDSKLTRADQTIGTPQYMSPEQAAFHHDEVDTRSDVYALGVLLFELIAEKSPFETEGKSPLAIRQLICDTDAPKPSESMGSSMPFSARDIKGDLDWIVAKVLAREKQRRYNSPAELAADINRHQSQLPVVAGPDEMAYRIRKFVRRHRMGVAVAAMAVIAVVVGLAGTSVGLLRALEAERAAAESAEIANQTVAFVEDIFSAADPLQTRGGEVLAKEILDQGVIRMRNDTQLPAPARASMLQTMGSAYSGLGLYTDATPLFEEAIDLFEAAPGADLPLEQYFKAQRGLAQSEIRVGDPAEAMRILDALLEEEINAYGPDDARLIDTRILKQRAFSGVDQAEAAIAHFDIAMELANDTAVPDEKRAYLISAVAPTYVAEGNHAQAIAIGHEAVQLLTSSLGPDHPQTLAARANLAWYLSMGRSYAEAEQEFLGIVDATERTFGKDHFGLGITLFNLGSLQRNLGRYEDALQNYSRALEIWGDQLGPDHDYSLAATSNIAQIYYDLGQHARSEAMYLGMIAQERRLLAADDPDRAFGLNNLGMVYLDMGRHDEALALLQEAQALRIAALGDGHAYVLDGYTNIGRALLAKGMIDEAAASFQKAIDLGTERYSENNPIVSRAKSQMGRLLINAGRASEAQPYLTSAISGFSEEYPEGYWETAVAKSLYGEALRLSGDLANAEQFLNSALEALLASEDRNSSHTSEAIDRLARLYDTLGDDSRRAELLQLRDDILAEAAAAP